MTPFFYALTANIVIAAILIGIFFLLGTIRKLLERHIKTLTAFTVGILLALVFFQFLPELQEHLDHSLGLWFLGGILFFYITELFLHWHHCGDLDTVHCHDHGHAEAHEHTWLMTFGTVLHNIFHGVVLYSAFAISFEFGIASSIAIALHALPQNIANYVMNHKDKKAALLAAGGGVIGVLLIYPFGSFIIENKYNILAVVSGGLLYLALTDILPSLNGKGTVREKVKQFIVVLLGIMLLFFLTPEEHGHEEVHEELELHEGE